MTARIDPSARIHPTAIIGDQAMIGAGCVVGAYAIIEGRATIGPYNRIGHHVVIGGEPQDQKYHGEDTEVVIGVGNVFREFVTVHRGTEHGGGVTRLGDRNYLMAYVHVGHDCLLSHDIILTNGAQLAGHVQVERYAHFGGLAGVHQYVRIGESAFVGAGAMVRHDLPPYAMARGDRAHIVGLNEIGLQRRGFSEDRVERIGEILMDLCFQRESSYVGDPDYRKLKEFFDSSKIGVMEYKAREHLSSLG